jgi:hypothetical protein
MATTNFIINPSSVSMEEIRTDIKTYLDSAPDSLKWKDYFATGSGKTLIDLIAGLGAFLSYNIITGRRENYLPYVQNRSSALGISEALGYSAFRGRNATLTVTVLPTITTIITKFSSIGTVKDQDLLVLEDTPLVAGVAVSIPVVIGTVYSESQTVTTTGPAVFRFTKTGVSQDVRVFLNSTEIGISEHVLDLMNEKFTILSNVYGSANVSYLNLDSFAVKYNIGDVVTLYWVGLVDTQFSSTDLKFDYGTLTSFVINENFKAVETTSSIQVNAPLFNETQFIIRGRDDYMKTFRLLNVGIVDTSYTDISAALVDLSYVQQGGCLFANSELNQFVSQLALFRPMGLKPPTISHPNISFLNLNVGVKVSSSSGNPSTDVGTVIAAKENLLGAQVVIDDLENAIERYSYIKIARVSIAGDTWQASHSYRYGRHVKSSPDNGLVYKMIGYTHDSGTIEPTWPSALPFSQTVDDNKLQWCMVNLDIICPPITPSVWQASHGYKMGDIIIPTSGAVVITGINVGFQVCGIVNKSKSDTPAVASTFTYTGATVAHATYDGHLFVACFAGSAGNLISLVFDGVMTVQQVVDVWNTANPTNCVKFYPLSAATHVCPAGSVTLTDGNNSSSIGFTAQTAGSNGNNINLTFDGFTTAADAATAYNASHPTNQVMAVSTKILPISTSIQLEGGAVIISGEPAWPGSINPPC